MKAAIMIKIHCNVLKTLSRLNLNCNIATVKIRIDRIIVMSLIISLNSHFVKSLGCNCPRSRAIAGNVCVSSVVRFRSRVLSTTQNVERRYKLWVTRHRTIEETFCYAHLPQSLYSNHTDASALVCVSACAAQAWWLGLLNSTL